MSDDKNLFEEPDLLELEDQEALIDELIADETGDLADDFVDVDSDTDSASGSASNRLPLALLVLAAILWFVLPWIANSADYRATQSDGLANSVVAFSDLAQNSLRDSADAARLPEQFSRLNTQMQRLISDGAGSGLSTSISGLSGLVSEIEGQWQQFSTATDALNQANTETVELRKSVQVIDNNIDDLSASLVGMVETVARAGSARTSAKDKDAYLYHTSESSFLLALSGRIEDGVNNLFAPASDPRTSVDELNTNVVRFTDTLARIVERAGSSVVTVAEPVTKNFTEIAKRVVELDGQVAPFTSAKQNVNQMSELADSLSLNLRDLGGKAAAWSWLSVMATLIPLALVGIAVWMLFRERGPASAVPEEQETQVTAALAGQQEAILQLLDEMSALADGDLTVEAEVTDQITGAIADSVNFAVIEMRDLVRQINKASDLVARESRTAANSASEVSSSSTQQATLISGAAQKMNDAAKRIQQMATQAQRSSDMANESLQVANKGAQAVRDTISGMDDIREQIQETSKRIKRLGESSQRIGDIVALIEEIAEQTNILSLNAAIQASMAGEAGRGFAVVSDEVQSLAERSADATKRISELVETIQTDTNDAVASMEKATQEVVAGTKVADSAGEALAAIETVSNQLSEVVINISNESVTQAEAMNTVSTEVSEVSKRSTQMSGRADETSVVINRLSQLAEELDSSVSRFKLPAE